MDQTAVTKTVGDKTLPQRVDDKNKVEESSIEYGSNRVCYRKAPSWQRPISSFFTAVQKKNAVKTDGQPPVSQITAPKDSLDDTPVDIVVNVDVQAYLGLPDEEETEKDQVADAEQIPEEKEDEPPSKRIKYDELAKHVHFLESLLP